MEVISVNVGQPREVEWRGTKVQTSIWKQPVQGRIFVSHMNLAGNAQADLVAHGGEHRAVMVYQMDSYRHWSSYLKRSDLVPGNLGENLTVEGLADSEVCIGDRFRIGTAVFEVTQPRVTCYKVGIRMNVPEMPALLVSHRRPGFYFRVIEEGEIGAGDSIEKIANGPERMTVMEIDALLYTANHPMEALQKALRIPALSLGWRGSFQELVNAGEARKQKGNAGLVAPAPHLAWSGFRPLRVCASKAESEDVRSFEFESEDRSALPDALPGQHLAVRLPVDESRPPVTRMYSLCGRPGTGIYRIAVKREPNGTGSGYLHQHVRAGSVLEVSAPRGTFTLIDEPAPLVLLSAGVGVTPVLAMLYSVIANKSSSPREVWWIHSAQNKMHHSFADEVREVAAGLASVHLINVYSRPTEADLVDRDYTVKGHLNLALLKQIGVPQHGAFYLCGPDSYLREIVAELHEWEVPASRIFFEAFGPPISPTTQANAIAPHLPADNTGTGPSVTFTRSGISFRWNTRFQSLLEAAEAADVPVKWSCRSGVCHRCESGLIGGDVRYSPEPLDAPAVGNVLICCSVPVTDVELDL